MKNKKEIIKELEQLKEEIRQKYKVKQIGVFGSVVRNKHDNVSDIDILVDFENNADFFDFVGLSLFLEEKLNEKVDIVPKRALREEIKETVLREVSYV